MADDGWWGEIAIGWAPFAGFWLILLVLAAAEQISPLRHGLVERRGRLATNFALGLINLGLATLLPLSAVAAGGYATVRGWGLLHAVQLPLAAAIAATLIACTLAQYAVHRLAHRSAFLWRFHRIHHADTVIDLSTGFRNHPAELLLLVLVRMAWATALGPPLVAILVAEGFSVVVTMWNHANLRLTARLDRALRLVVVTPTMHHFHHSSRQAETDSNYGELFSCWDRLFGSYCAGDAAALAEVRPGLGDDFDPRSASLISQLWLPFARKRSRPIDSQACPL